MRHDAGSRPVLCVLGVLVFCFGLIAQAAPDEIPKDIPEKLRVKGPVVGVVHATGVQVYTCVVEDKKPTWKLKEPNAKFENAAGLKGTHYRDNKVPAGPAWKADDGSAVVGNKVNEQRADKDDSVPWLLLEAIRHEGNGKLSGVTYIQRIHTSGGVAPAIGQGKVGDEMPVKYEADYVFYGPGATTQPAAAR